MRRVTSAKPRSTALLASPEPGGLSRAGGRLVRQIESDAAAERKLTGREPLGPIAILSQQPQTRPEKLKKSPAPLFHAASKDARQGLRAADGLFLAAFREAAERLKAGDRLARFPNGCFPPALPFVGSAATASS